MPDANTTSRERYSKLAPLHISAEMLLVSLALMFFSPGFQIKSKNHQKGVPLKPSSGGDFIEYLDAIRCLPEKADRYFHQLGPILHRMVEHGLLVDMGVGGGAYVMLPNHYYTFYELSKLRQRGGLWMAKVLGGRLVHHLASPAIVHIVGENDQGEREGSGIIFDKHHVLTCKHVVSGMRLAPTQAFQGKTVTVDKVFTHPSEDVAVIRIKEPLTTVPGLGFVDPVVSQKVYRFGYSRVPCSVPSSTGTSPLVMQSGEVTNESTLFLGGTKLFLYSAISRPGDSGGAVISDDGYVVGMTTELLDSRAERKEGEEVFSPHYAGIPSGVLAKAVSELGLGVQIPMETYE
ncbi:MAG: serine protease [Aestuariivita sp.]|nr:serine protease [Aestuariivita sp.]